jgi:hypothetical protein
MTRTHVIDFPSKEDRLKAIEIFLDVPMSRMVLPGGNMVVTGAHIEALQRENISFIYVSKTGPNGSQPTPVQP